MYCPKCGKGNPDDAKFCMFCGVAIGTHRIDISPKIEVSPTFYIEKEDKLVCAICGTKATGICSKCRKPVCERHLEGGAECTLCRIDAWEELHSIHLKGELHAEQASAEFTDDRFWKSSVEWHRDKRKEVDKEIETLKRKLMLK